MNKLKYIAYYSDPDETKSRKTEPSADTKADYIISALKAAGYEVSVVSMCYEKNRVGLLKKSAAYVTEKNGTQVHFVPSATSKYRVMRLFARQLMKRSIRQLVKKECIDTDCKIVIYHSLGMYDVIKLLKRHNKAFTLEVEEIYSDVMTKRKKQNRKKEDFMFSAAQSYIFSTELLNKEINTENKPYAVCNGTYTVAESLAKEKIFDDKEKIHCVYAGTLDPRKGGATAAATAGGFLPENYHMHILGFGSAAETENMKKLTEQVNSKAKATVTYDGLLTGEEYLKFIQSCDIGLSTQDPNADFNGTSFPSKILSYMSNGLRVVSVRIPVVEQSAVGDMLYYYNNQTPEEIAKAIMAVDINDGYDSRLYLSGLDKKFAEEVGNILDTKKVV